MTENSETPCVFCCILRENKTDIIRAQNKHAFVIETTKPQTKGHLLVISKRHVVDFTELTEKEVLSIHLLTTTEITKAQAVDDTITAYQIRENFGIDAGQTIPHVHRHIVLRRKNESLAYECT